jgi:hypothetical protein
MSRAWSAFLFFHAGAVVLDATERWQRPHVALAMLGCAGVLLWAPGRLRRYTDVAWLVVSAAPLLVLAPDLANHRNLTLYVNAVLLGAWAVGSWRARGFLAFDDTLFSAAAPVLRASVCVVYFFAGFHKLNRDFLFEPAVSCAGWFAVHLGQPWLAPGAPPTGAWVTALAFLVVAWELGLAAALLMGAPRGRARRVALWAAWLLHGLLALSGFYDFSALMFALLWTFVPAELLAGDDRLVDRARQGAAWVLAGGLGAGALLLFVPPALERLADLLQGAVLNAALLWCAVPLMQGWRSRPSGPPVPPSPSMPSPGPLWLAPALLAVFASSNYLGLRTAGTFSMFSNLRTERGQGNHLLVPADHPLVLGRFQHDVVWIEALEARASPPGPPLDGLGLPRVELDRHLERWRAQGLSPVRAIIRGEDGVRHALPDLTLAPGFTEPRHPWAMRLLDFRPVQPDPARPNACRW